MFIDPETDTRLKRGLFNAIVAPRPIGWISSIDVEGRPNLAPFSYFNIVSSAPPILMFSCNTPEDRLEKDTLANVRATGEFVYNLVSADLAEAMNESAFPLPPGESEFAFAGVEQAESVKIRPFRVAASPCNIECRVIEILQFGGDRAEESLTHVVFGRVVGIHIADGFLDRQGYFDTMRARPIVRLGGVQYGEVERTFELERRFRPAQEERY